ncbi:MAG: cytochrome c biogenesis protein, partial [Akkermansiaceae bacterium]|nr:cytochrome c biogenesis protein [Akkermansiaceae bacterium]
LTQEHNLKFNKLKAVLSLLPPIERLERVTKWLLVIGLVLLTIGLHLGGRLPRPEGVQFIQDPKVVWSIVLWLACVALLVWSVPSLFVAKKVVALLLMPAGLAWLALLALVGWPGLRRWPRAVAVAALVAHTLAGNVWFGTWLLRGLEEPYLAAVEPHERLDAICLLGGGRGWAAVAGG